MTLMRWIAVLIAVLALPAQAELRDIRYDYQRSERAQTDFTAADAAVQRVVLAQLMLAQVTTNPGVTGVFNPASPGPIGATTPDAITGTTITAATKFVGPLGTAAAPSVLLGASTNTGWYSRSTDLWDFSYAGVGSLEINAGNFFMASGNTIGWLSGAVGTGGDLFLARDAANTVACRNGTNACTIRAYNTFTDASNYERLAFRWSANIAGIFTDQAGSGTARRLQVGTLGAEGIDLVINGTARWQIAAANGGLSSTNISNDAAAIAATAGSITGSGTTSFYTLAGTWNTSGVVPGAVQVNITNTASGAGSRLLELQRGGALQFGVTSGAASTGTQIRTAQATAPTCTTNCGTPGNVCAGSDTFMTCTMGTTPASGVLITFNGTWATAPACTVQMALAGMVVGKQVLTAPTTTTTVTLNTNGTAPVAGDKYHIICGGIS